MATIIICLFIVIFFILRYVQENRWQDALNLCRGADDNIVWVCLAVLATQSGADHFDVAEEAFAVINQYDKVLYLQHLKVRKSMVIANISFEFKRRVK